LSALEEEPIAIDASAVLGSAQLAGVKVNPRGFSWGNSSIQAGALATRIVLGRRPASGRAQTPQFGRLTWLAVTSEELALVKLRSSNGVTVQPREVIARVPRRELKTVEWHRGYVSPLVILFSNGDQWHLEVPPLNARNGAKVVHALGLPVMELRSRGAAE
jgi:hypothetical protein